MLLNLIDMQKTFAKHLHINYKDGQIYNGRTQAELGLGLSSHLFLKAPGTGDREGRDFFGHWVKLPPITTSLTAQR